LDKLVVLLLCIFGGFEVKPPKSTKRSTTVRRVVLFYLCMPIFDFYKICVGLDR
jgi:hypothetical protein